MLKISTFTRKSPEEGPVVTEAIQKDLVDLYSETVGDVTSFRENVSKQNVDLKTRHAKASLVVDKAENKLLEIDKQISKVEKSCKRIEQRKAS